MESVGEKGRWGESVGEEGESVGDMSMEREVEIAREGEMMAREEESV